MVASDLSGNGSPDIVVSTMRDDRSIFWLAGTVSQTPTPLAPSGDPTPAPTPIENMVAARTRGVGSIASADFDRDGNADVVTASYFENTIAWYRNLGGGSFGDEQVISTNALGAVKGERSCVLCEKVHRYSSKSVFEILLLFQRQHSPSSSGQPQEVISQQHCYNMF